MTIEPVASCCLSLTSLFAACLAPITTLLSLSAGLNATYSFEPLSNLVYTRDQQITTCKGIVMGRLRSPQRNLEVSLMKFCLQKLGEPSLQPSLANLGVCRPALHCWLGSWVTGWL